MIGARAYRPGVLCRRRPLIIKCRHDTYQVVQRSARAQIVRAWGIGLRSAGRIGEDHRPVLQPPLAGEPEVEPGGVHVLEQPLPCAGYDGHDPEAELVDQVASHERVVEAAGAVLDEGLAGLVLQPGDRAGWVGPEEGGIPCRLGQRSRCDVLGHGVDEVDVGIASDVAPVRVELLVGHPAHDERVVVAQLLDGQRGGLGVEVGPPFRRFDDAVERDKGRVDQFAHSRSLSPSGGSVKQPSTAMAAPVICWLAHWPGMQRQEGDRERTRLRTRRSPPGWPSRAMVAAPAPRPGREPDVRLQSLPLLIACASAASWRSSALAALLRQLSATDWDTGSGKMSSSSFSTASKMARATDSGEALGISTLRVMSVSTGPVRTAWTCTPRPASRARSDCVRLNAAAFEIE